MDMDLIFRRTTECRRREKARTSSLILEGGRLGGKLQVLRERERPREAGGGRLLAWVAESAGGYNLLSFGVEDKLG